MADQIHMSSDQEQLVLVLSEQTGCDFDVAYSLLDQNDWQFTVALDIYEQIFSSHHQPPQKTLVCSSTTPSAVNNFSFTVNGDDGDDEVVEVDSFPPQSDNNVSLSAAVSTPYSLSSSIDLQDSADELFSEDVDIRFRIISWNIDCLCEKLLKPRLKGLFYILRQKQPDVVFLQEVIEPVLGTLYDVFLEQYYVYRAESNYSYFVVMMVNKAVISNVTFNTIPFLNSEMGRNLVRCTADYFGLPISFYTTHLESTKSVFKTRIEQMKQCVTEMHNDQSHFKLLGGDLNIRDSELTSIDLGCLRDAWVSDGSKKDKQYTWDMSKNDNLESMSRTNVKCRFDRFYYHSMSHQITAASSNANEPTSTDSKQPVLTHALMQETEKSNDKFELINFELLGTDKLACGMFPSDHFGIMCDFKLNLV